MSIKQLAKKLNISLQGTHGDQAKHVSTIEWLLDPIGSEEITDKGRTTLLALGFINAAMENPNFPIVFFDHYAAPYNKVLMQEVLEGMVDRLPVGASFALTDHTITYQDKQNAKREDCENSENEHFAEIQRFLRAIVLYCEGRCPTRETCVDGKRTKEQEECPLFTTFER